MYFTVWDMFCGWSGWSFRTHVIAEGVSGQYYEITPTPWGEYHAFADLGRQHYDSFGNHAVRIGVNCLRQTQHEPMVHLYVFEETWSKRFNLPDQLWEQLHSEPKRPHRYHELKGIYRVDGSPISRGQSFHDRHQRKWLAASLRGRSGRHDPWVVLGN